VSEYRFPNPRQNSWKLVAAKRAWVPNWLYTLYSFLPCWLQPFRWIFNKEFDDEGDAK